MTDAAVLEPDAAIDRPRRQLRRVVGIGTVVAVVALATVWWFAGGTFVHVPQGNLLGLPGAPGEAISFGLPMEPDGDGAILRSVTATVTPTAPVQWSAYRAVNGQGFGSWLGPLEPRWAIEPVDGTPIGIEMLSATFVIGTLQTTVPGVYRVSNIAVHYDAGIRSRTAESLFVVCVLVTPPGSSSVELEASNDPLWQQYLQCNSGG